MQVKHVLIDFILKEWLLTVSIASLVLASIYTKNFPVYSTQEFQILFILFVLFIVVNGLQRSGLILKLSQSIDEGKAIPLKLLIITFFLSMVITNDITLIVIVPLTLALNINRKDILVIFEALSANAGSALTPFGNPQNLFIYWFYGLHPIEFIAAIAPLSIIFLLVLFAASLFIKTNNSQIFSETKKTGKYAYIYGILLLIVLLIVLHVLPLIAGLIIIIFVLLFDQKTLYIDYALLLSFFFFFGLAENMKIIFESRINHSAHIFLFSALVSQVMSNVPASLLFAKFTENWKALLWGTNVGGFGSLLGSFANLIAYKIYVTHESTNNSRAFTGKFILIGYTAFFMSIGLYFCLYGF